MSKLQNKLNNAMIVRGFSESTRHLYIRAVRELSRYYNRSPDAITEPEIHTYLLYLTTERRLAPSTINVVISALKFFYTLLNKDEPRYSFNIRLQKYHYKLAEILSVEEVQKIIDSTENLKHRVIMMLAYGAGLRASEILNLRVSDIDSQRMVIHVKQGKGSKDRYALLSPQLLSTLRAYWRQYHPCDLLFPGVAPNVPIIHASVYKFFNELKRKLGIKKKGGIHSLRHAFATHMLESGVDLFHIQQLLGHQNIRSTVRYLRLSNAQMHRIQSPLDKLKLS